MKELPWTVAFSADQHPATITTVVCRCAIAHGLSERAAWEVATAASELVTNAQKFAGGGRLTMRSLSNRRAGLEVVVDDDGPGIDQPDAVVRDGFSEGRQLPFDGSPARGLGVGLGGVERLMDSLEIHNKDRGGVRIVTFKRAEARK